MTFLHASCTRNVAVAALVLLPLACGDASTQPAAESTTVEEPPMPPASANASPTTPEGRNRLSETASPYLLQHAANPVNWWPWGDEAFEAARALDRPIFLSIGYSTCYWCHVMERESFEDDAIAEYLNEHFICIKVDREERPDVDEIYMSATQLMNDGRGGWPMTLFLEPTSLRPFFAGTYFPPVGSGGRPGFLDLATSIAEGWTTNRDPIMQQADAVARAVTNRLSVVLDPVPVTAAAVDAGTRALMARYDAVNAGFASAPKFPMPMYATLLMQAAWEDDATRSAVTHTLDRMLMGGMYDQVGGGFHRYSTDRAWLVPHFEKMLYDNGQLASLYAEAYDRTGDGVYGATLRETLDYVLRELTHEQGGFLSAQDAESNHREGETYIWLPRQARAAMEEGGLDADTIELAMRIYGLDAASNFRDPHFPQDGGRWVLRLSRRPDLIAQEEGMAGGDFHQAMVAINTALLAARDKRDQPLTDDKVIAAWNGLMIAGMADGGRVLNDQRYVDAAASAASFVLSQMRAENGALMRSWREGRLSGEGFLEDYGAMLVGLLSLHRASGDQTMLEEAIDLYDEARRRFHVEYAGWYDTQAGQGDLFVRTRSMFDGAFPAPTSLVLSALVTLEEVTADRRYLNDAMEIIDVLSPLLERAPVAAPMALSAIDVLMDRYPAHFAASTGPDSASDSVVSMRCEPATLSIPRGGSIDVVITLEMERPWHVNSNAPGGAYAVPMDIVVVGSGMTAMPKWPAATVMAVAGERLNVYGDSVSIPVTLSAAADASGTPALMIRWQACDDARCLQPETNQVPIRITIE